MADRLRGNGAVDCAKVADLICRTPENDIPVFEAAALAVLFLARRRDECVVPITSTLKEVQQSAQMESDLAEQCSRISACISCFCLDAAWLNEGRCPGGRPSVS